MKNQRIEIQYEEKYKLCEEWDEEKLLEVLTLLCHKLDLSRPVILEKHVLQMNKYGKTSFKHFDFVDYISFDSLDIEWLGEMKKNQDDYAKIMNDFSIS